MAVQKNAVRKTPAKAEDNKLKEPETVKTEESSFEETTKDNPN